MFDNLTGRFYFCFKILGETHYLTKNNATMYLAPLNYDRFFERIFKDPLTAQSFLEDVLNKSITELEVLPRKNKITDDAAFVEFDFRCKMDGVPTTIDMQQWYKLDVVKRFFMYFCNNTSLQLETLKPIRVPLPDGKEYKTKDYNGVESAITLIWMADDSMSFDDDMVAYSIFPELLNDFIRNKDLWETENSASLLEQRAAVLKVMDNKSKNLDFLPTNRLVYMFQRNIVNNKKMSKYFKWFEFAQKTKNRNNVAADFKKYSNDPILVKVMEKLKTNVLPTDDFQYITDFEAHAIGVKNYNDMILREGLKEERQRITYFYEDKIQRAEQRAEQEKQRAEQEKQILLTKQLHLVEKCLKRGDSLEAIESFLEIDRETLDGYIEQLNRAK
jgi:hypothetical protein